KVRQTIPKHTPIAIGPDATGARPSCPQACGTEPLVQRPILLADLLAGWGSRRNGDQSLRFINRPDPEPCDAVLVAFHHHEALAVEGEGLLLFRNRLRFV